MQIILFLFLSQSGLTHYYANTKGAIPIVIWTRPFKVELQRVNDTAQRPKVPVENGERRYRKPTGHRNHHPR